MNSRFKFRAWDKENKVLHYNAECAYDSMNGTPPLMHDSFGSLLDDDNFIIEQSTGLADKNGKLIYEGDVVRCITGVVGKVVYFYSGFKVVFDDPMSYPCDIWENQEIIGNIHEDQFRDLAKKVEDNVCE